jgi:DNA (cytosine-5)-methyltransferase 1
MNEVKFGSVCSGIEAASVAWKPLGWKAVWLSEIEPFPSAVLAHHYPDTPNLGDMTKLVQKINYGEIEAPELFCGGTPCQAFSVAGLRKSLDDVRGNLSLVFCEVANAIDSVRNVRGASPAIIFWENVPGVLNTSDNAFGCFLAGLAGEDEALQPAGGKWTNAGCVFGPKRAVAWRVLDAQYFGVAQRRRRVFVVASARKDFDPAAVLFEFDGLRWDTAPSREAGKVAPTIPSRSTASGGLGTDFDCDGGVIQHAPEIARCIATIEGSSQDWETTTMVAQPVPTYAIQGSMIGRNDQAGPNGEGVNEEVCFTQNTTDRHAVVHPIPLNTMTMQGRPSDNGRMGSGIGEPGDPCPTLTKGHSHAVAFHPTQDPISSIDGTTHAMGCGSSGGQASIAVAQNMAVRRLTPTECERLQGFPDGYTAIPWRNKTATDCPDGPRYKALGNSWAVPVVRWIGERINKELGNDQNATND